MAGYKQPIAPKYSPGWNPETDTVTDGVMSNFDQRALNRFRGEALRTGPSVWAGLAKKSVGMQEADMRERAARDAASGTATARNQLAMRGGMTGGGAERVAQDGARNYMSMNQEIGRQSADNMAQIDLNDEQNRIQQLGMMPGMEAQKAQLFGQSRSFDVGQKMGESTRLNAFNAQKYSDDMGAYSAWMTGKAQENAGGGSSFICTALRAHGLMSRKETKEMTRFMLDSLVSRADFFAWYFRNGQKAIELAERQNFDWIAIKARFVDEILEIRDRQGMVAAQNAYAERAGAFVTQFLGECGYTPSLAQPGLLKGLLKLPLVFTLPGTWKWAYAYFTPRVKKYGVRSMRKLGLA